MPFWISGFSPVVKLWTVIGLYKQHNTDIKSSTEVKSESIDYNSLLKGVDVNDLFSDN